MVEGATFEHCSSPLSVMLNINRPLLVVNIKVDFQLNYFMMPFMNITADDLKQARQHLSETHEQFAKRFGVDRSTYTGWELGNIPTRGTAPAVIQRILEELNAEPDNVA
jgi:DNA-binding transcriptional regulator YiaG